MKVLDPGHHYVLDVLDRRRWWWFSRGPEKLRFVKRAGEKYPGNMNAYSGTTLQEVLRACIDRVKYVNQQIPDETNDSVITVLRMAIYWLERRAYRRHGVEFDLDMRGIEDLPVNSHGHLWKE